MEIKWLQDFTCLAKTLSFTRAAEKQNITQSAFSRRIRSLESWLGVPLIDRASYPIQLSDAGQQFLPVAQQIIANLIDIRQVLRAQELDSTAFQRFAVLHTISLNYLSRRISELETVIPDLRVRIYSDNLRVCCQLLSEGICDFLLYYRHEDVQPVFEEAHFARIDIGVEHLVPVALTKAVEDGNWHLDAENQNSIPYLSYDPSSFLGCVVDHTIGHRAPPLSIRYMDVLTEAIKRRMLQGGGIAWLPESVVSEELTRGLVMKVGGVEWQAPLTLSLFCSPTRLDKTGEQVWNAFRKHEK